MKDSCVLSLPSYSSHPLENQYGQQNEVSETNSSQRTDSQSGVDFSQKVRGDCDDLLGREQEDRRVEKENQQGARVKWDEESRPLDQSGTSNICGVLGVASQHIDVESIKSKEQQNLQTDVTNNRNQISVVVQVKQSIKQVAPSEIQPLYGSRAKEEQEEQKENVQLKCRRGANVKPDSKASGAIQHSNGETHFRYDYENTQQDQCYDECDDYISNYEDSRPQLHNFCFNSNIDNEYGNRWDRDQYLY